VPTRTVPQGIAAQVAFSSDLEAEEAAAAMEDAAGAVRTVEVTRATRSVTLDEIAVREGDVLGLVDDKLVVAAATVQEAAERALDAASAQRSELITAYYGQAVDDTSAQQLGAALRTRFPKAEIEVVAGGQPHYDFIISVE